MKIPFLDEPVVFPPAATATPEGVVAYGGNLDTDTLLQAYRNGIFPWYSESDPHPVWWSPPYRMVLIPGKHRLSHSMRPYLNGKKFSWSVDRAFRDVISACRDIPRDDQDGTWITDEMLEAYCRLHSEGHAHSFEVWNGKKLVGGLYGVAVGRMFCGESMFSRQSNASKFGFIALSAFLKEQGFILLDCQNYSSHLESLGAFVITRENYLEVLETALSYPSLRGHWQNLQ